MDSGLTIRPVANGAETAHVRPDAQPVRAAVATTLAASQSVTAAAGTGRPAGYDSAYNRSPSQAAPAMLMDPQSREVMFRAIEARTGLAERQIREAALRRVRAYAKPLAGAASRPEAHSGTDSAV